MLDQLFGCVSERYRLLNQVFTEFLDRKDSVTPSVLVQYSMLAKFLSKFASSEGTIEILRKITRPHCQKKAVGIPFIIMKYGGVVVEEEEGNSPEIVGMDAYNALHTLLTVETPTPFQFRIIKGCHHEASSEGVGVSKPRPGA